MRHFRQSSRVLAACALRSCLLGCVGGGFLFGFAAGSALANDKLSDWLLAHPEAQAFPPGVMVLDDSQRSRQAYLQRELLVDVFPGDARAADSPDVLNAEARQRWTRWIAAMPVTGRVPVINADARWLQNNPLRDPFLGEGMSVRTVPRPRGVTVVLPAGHRCRVPHASGASPQAYVESCRRQTMALSSALGRQAYLIQPDGRIEEFGLEVWNTRAVAEAAPGAWVWVPPRGRIWTGMSHRLAAFLATQGPSLDEGDALLTSAPEVAPSAGRAWQPDRLDDLATPNDWGFMGLWQTPTARMGPPTDMRFQWSRVWPYTRGSVIFHPLDWLEAGFRYTDIANVLYGPAALSGDQSYKDKSIDVKVKLWSESSVMPEIAVGVQDIGGTGLFSGEYVVGSKRFNEWDWSLGMGWGYNGGRGDIKNPLSSLSSRFATRAAAVTGQGGTISSSTFFSGPAAIFGGVETPTPVDGMRFKLEYEGNHYQREPHGNNQVQRSPVNLGVVYRMYPGVNISLAYERGNQLMLGLTLKTELEKIFASKILDPKMPPVVPQRPSGEPDWSATARELELQTGWKVLEIEHSGADIKLCFADNGGAYWVGRLDRVAAVLHRDSPATVDRFLIQHEERGIVMTSNRIDRDTWVAGKTRYMAFGRPDDGLDTVAPDMIAGGRWNRLLSRDDGQFRIGLAPSFLQSLGGPDGFILFQFGVATPFEWQWSPSTWVSGALDYQLINNYDKFKYTAPSGLPRVRTYQREYRTSSDLTMPTLQLTHVGQAGSNHFYSLYGGYLEPYFAGVGGEWLYRPWQSVFAFGVDINQVRQRTFEQDFDLRDYRVTTGHGTLYWDTRWQGVQVQLSAGQYLAGDRGATLAASRTFRNGVTVGAFATKTDVPKEIFGEGSFDKGIYVSVPFDAMLLKSSPMMANFVWNPLTRDGGAKLMRSNPLYGLTHTRSKQFSEFRPAQDIRREAAPIPGPEDVMRDVGGSLIDLGGALSAASVWRGALLGGGIILGSALLDRAGDRWALSHQGGKWEPLATGANSIPIALGLGVGLLWTGFAGDYAADTSWTAIKSTAMSLGLQYGAKSLVGRARPETGLGPKSFDAGSNGGGNSSWPSGHMTVAFSVVTPFAQNYNAPWLYAVATTTAYGRIQQRKHWVSDTVAGALLGYGVASFVNENDRRQKNLPRVGVDADRNLIFEWQF
jgi:membrane-associated phospholipid phosphatase